ncbi:hypothetical protein GUJ93_ZPchr0008g12815 [Zizania palustris]|uniref:Uncharacterized protein n=1 Tax=Zizania palustris TaxID=103762 RepID=A0A8J5V3G1_ZIZPA|nr:hypothetical protein GUJ93_ZPchr0008g12815 [Zizania palustris]
MGREAAAACSPKPKLKRGLWSPEEDEKLYNHIIRYGVGCWSSVPKLAGLERCGKSCRLRWINYLRPDLKRGSFSLQEEDLIITLHKILGNRWSQIASQLPGRTDNEIKNFWNSCLKKKLRQQGIDPATHKPLDGTDDDGVGVGVTDQKQQDEKQQHVLDYDCGFAIGGGGGCTGSVDSPAAPHSPDVSFDPLSVTNVPAMQPPYGAAAANSSFVSDTLCDYGGGDAGTYSAYTVGGGGGDSSSNSNSTAWTTCGNVVVGEPLTHMDMFGRDAEPYPFDPARFSPWHPHHHEQPQPQPPPHQHHPRLDGAGAASFPIRSLSRDMPESCFSLARGALEDEFDFL